VSDGPALEPLADRLEAAVGDLARLAPAVQAGAPWPLADVFGIEPEASWGPPEVLAHVAEMLPFWLGEMERILEGPAGGPVPFGRTQDDAVRLAVIGRDRTVPARELFARITADGGRVAGRARELSGAEAARTGLHPRLGEMTVGHVLERFVVTHVEDHVRQLADALGGAA
jgi:hypothetical protein